MTNFEMIASDEETLASCLEDLVDCKACPKSDECTELSRCKNLLLQWLKEEA